MLDEPGEVLRRDHLLYIDADRAVAGHGDEGQVAGVGEIELEPGVFWRGKDGFTIRCDREGQLLSGQFQVAAEDIAQGAVGGDETLAVFGEAVAVGAGALVCRECGEKPIALRGGDMQGCLPNVNGVR